MEEREERLQRIKRRKRKRVLTTCIMVVLVIGLGAGYLAIKKDNEKKEKRERLQQYKQELEAMKEIKKITTFSYNDAAELDVTNEETSYGFYKVDQKVGYKWVRKGMESFPTKATKVMDIIQEFCHMQVDTTISGKDADLSEFGLDNPKATVRIQLKDGSVHQFSLGAEAPYSAGHYFLYNVTGDIYIAKPGVYVQVSTPELGMAMEETFPTTTKENIQKVTIGVRDGEVTEYVPQQQGDGNVIYPDCFADCVKFVASRIKEYDCKDFSIYGLDNPYVTVTVNYKGYVTDAEGNKTEENLSMTAEIGDEAQEGGYYVRINKSPFVYIMSEAFAKKYIPN